MLDKTQQQIDQILEQFTQRNLINWRPHQREAVEQICLEVLNGTTDIILDAPTGSGKSLIAMASSHVLRSLDRSGYLLVSDLELQNQYEEDLQRYWVDIPSVKGADNYTCDDNQQKTSLGTCNLKKTAKKKLPCYSTCEYYSRRDNAIAAPFSLLNYSYWLIQMNYVNLRSSLNNFIVRDVCFLDEAHKLDLIIHNHFAPRLNSSLITALTTAQPYLQHNSTLQVQALMEDLKRFKSNTDVMKVCAELKEILLLVALGAKGYLNDYKFHDVPDSNEIKMLNAFDRIKDVFCKIQDFEELVVTNEDLVTKTVDSDEISLNYLDSQQMLSVFFQRYTKQRVFMSATWGNLKSSTGFLGITSDYKHIKVPNEFDWSSSKYQTVGKHSLTWANRENDMMGAIRDLDQVLEKYPGKRGLIHAGSYSFAESIITHSKFPTRFTQYRSSEEKTRALLEHRITTDSVLIGPSLLEGINLPDDQCDFIIFFKCPYMGLGSEFVNRKAQLYPDWYLWKTALSIEQGCGRGMRHRLDKCDVWFIDSSFVKFFHQNAGYLSDEFLDRTLDPLDRMLL